MKSLVEYPNYIKVEQFLVNVYHSNVPVISKILRDGAENKIDNIIDYLEGIRDFVADGLKELYSIKEDLQSPK